ILNVNIDRPKIVETTALGAAYLAGLEVGFYDNLSSIKNNCKSDKHFTPSMEDEKRKKLYKGWKKSVSRALDWAREEEE
ncbi:glycerol kinase, partial [Clostridioides difficile]|nr:glycerol kinase [Clostridioides difficile]